jgi:YVTN family beta-propeller protein
MGTQGVKLSRTEHDDRREFPPFILDIQRTVLLREGRPVEITAKAISVLVALVQRHGEIVSKETLMREVWADVSVGQANLPTQILTLRRALGEFGNEYIQTVPGRGYRFSAPLISPPSIIASLERREPKSEPAPQPQQPVQPDQHESSLANAASSPPAHWRSLAKRWAMSILATLVLLIAGFIAHRLLVNQAPAGRATETFVPAAAWDGPRVLTMIPVPGGSDRVLLSPDGRQLYVAKEQANSVSVVDTRTNTVAAAIRVGNKPSALAAAPDGRKVYVGLLGGNVSAIDVASKHVMPMDTAGGPIQDIAITPDARSLYLAMGYLGVRRIDLETNRISKVSTLGYARKLAITPDGKRLYVSYQSGDPNGSPGHDSIGYFDLAANRLIGTIHGFPNVGECLNVSPDGSQIWEDGGDACLLTSYDHAGCPFVPAGVMNVLSSSENRLLRTIALEGPVNDCAGFVPGGPAMVATQERLLLIDTKNFNIVGSVPISSFGKPAIARDGSVAYAPVSGRNQVAVLELTRHVQAIALDDAPNAAGTLPIAILSTTGFNARSVDPRTLKLNGKQALRTAEGIPEASQEGIRGWQGLQVIVNFPAKGVQPNSDLELEGKTLSGVSIRSTIHVGK